MISTFDLVKLHSLLKDFYTLTRIRICVFDENFNELASYPESLPLFCRTLRATPNGYNECVSAMPAPVLMLQKQKTPTPIVAMPA